MTVLSSRVNNNHLWEEESGVDYGGDRSGGIKSPANKRADVRNPVTVALAIWKEYWLTVSRVRGPRNGDLPVKDLVDDNDDDDDDGDENDVDIAIVLIL